MPKSLVDWMGVILFWLGAALAAIKQAGLPLMASAPTFFAGSVWNYLPLLMMTVGLAVFLYRQLRPRAAVNAEIASPLVKSDAIRTAGAVPVTQPQSVGSRIYVSGELNPYDLMELCEGKTTHQAKRELAHYVGKWMRVEGIFEDFAIHYERFAVVTILRRNITEGKGVTIPDPRSILFYFDNDFERLEMIRRGERIVIDGKIREVDAYVFKLEECEVVETGDGFTSPVRA